MLAVWGQTPKIISLPLFLTNLTAFSTTDGTPVASITRSYPWGAESNMTFSLSYDRLITWSAPNSLASFNISFFKSQTVIFAAPPCLAT